MKVLVLDAAQRSALAVTRSLGRLPGVTVTTAEAAVEALAGCSRYSTAFLQSPSVEKQPKAYLAWLSAVLSADHYDLVIPVTEMTSQLLLINQKLLPRLKLPFAEYDTVMALADKGKLISLAEGLGVPCPKSRWYASAETLDSSSPNFPVVLKPCLSKIYATDHWISTRVRVIGSREEMIAELKASPYLYQYPFMLQEFIPGKGAGVFCLYDRGQAVAFFAHQRLREKPPEGGVSVLCESAELDPEMLAHATRLLDSVRWHGVAMVEFRVSPTGKPYLMEVNTRFWGSLQLAIDAGIDFPRLLWQIEQGFPLAGPGHYRKGQRLRWLMGDVDGLYLYLRGRYSLAEKLKRLISFVTPRLRGVRHEVNRWGDMGPARHELRLYVKQLLER